MLPEVTATMFCLKVVRYCMYMWLHSNHGDNGVVYFLYRMLPEVAATMFCLKVVRYCMYMWLPMYLLQRVR